MTSHVSRTPLRREKSNSKHSVNSQTASDYINEWRIQSAKDTPKIVLKTFTIKSERRQQTQE
jgi:hypothetical protein